MLKRTLKSLEKYNPLTATGWVILFGVVYLFGTGFATGNAYSFLLSTVFFAVLLVLGVITRLEAKRARSFRFEWDSNAALIARQDQRTQIMRHDGFRPLPFLRIHLRIRGRLVVGRKKRLSVRKEYSFFHEQAVPFSFFLPFSGTLHANYTIMAKDCFGLCRAPVDGENEKVLHVRPAYVTDRNPPIVDAQQGDENQNRMKTNDIERYFMREYIPGDKERDINWKASSRYSKLFTRVSPVTQEKTQLITAYFRPYNSLPRDSVESLALLDRCKSVILFFLRSVRGAHPEYEFRFYIGNDLMEIVSDEDVESFASALASVHFRGYGGAGEIQRNDLVSGAYVFTTACDTGLNEFLAALSGNRAEIYRAYAASRVEAGAGVIVHLYDAYESVLPEAAIVTRSQIARNPRPVLSGSSVTDEAVEVRLVE